jgi:glycosyltransferase involved in cell wall biosynthesis
MTGGPRVLLNMLSSLDLNQFHPLVITQMDSQLVAEVEKLGVEVVIVPPSHMLNQKDEGAIKQGLLGKVKSYLSLKKYNKSIQEILASKQIDLVWTRNVKGVMFVGWACKWLKLPLVWDVGMETQSKGIVRFIHKIGLGLTTVIVTEADMQHKGIFGERLYEKFKEKFRTIYPGIPRDRIQEITDLREKKGISDKFEVITVGTVCERKNQKMFVDAAIRTCKAKSDVRFSIVGGAREESYLDDLKEIVSSSGYADRIIFLGWRDDVANIMAKSDLLVMTSVNEGVPYVIHEALYAQLPVIVTDRGGMPETVIDGVTGYIIPLNDVELLSSKIEFLMENQTSARSFGSAGYKFAQERYSPEKWSLNYASLFHKLTAS